MVEHGAARVHGDARDVPVLVWVLAAIFGLRAFITVVGAFIFAFPMGGVLGPAIGIILLAVAVAYGVVAWRMRYGERAIWIAAIVALLVNQLTLTVADLSLYGAIPPEDYAFVVVTVVTIGLLVVPSVRRFFVR
jgi:hypothetical protein